MMTILWKRSVLLFGFIGIIAVLTNQLFTTEISLIFLSLCLFGYCLLNLIELNKLHQWLLEPELKQLPNSSGVWAHVFSLLYRLVRQQNHSQLRLANLISNFQEAGEALPDGIVLLNPSGGIEWCNASAEQHFAIDRRRDYGQPLRNLIRSPHFLEFLNQDVTIQRKPLIFKPRRDQGLILSLQLSYYGEGQRLLISRDVTEIQKLEDMRRDFVANVSHELRTPLTVVHGFLETLHDLDDITESQKQYYIELMLTQTERMQHLVEDLLTLSRLENGQQPLKESQINIHRLMNTLYQEALSISKDQHEVELELSPNLNQYELIASSDEIRSAFTNLITNAIRYTPEGKLIKIRFVYLDDLDQMMFSVEDAGQGIPAEHIPRLTERFYRVDRGRSRETGGTGLGLAIVKQVITRHQAQLKITSELTKGSTFSIIFPSNRHIKID